MVSQRNVTVCYDSEALVGQLVISCLLVISFFASPSPLPEEEEKKRKDAQAQSIRPLLTSVVIRCILFSSL